MCVCVVLREPIQVLRGAPREVRQRLPDEHPVQAHHRGQGHRQHPQGLLRVSQVRGANHGESKRSAAAVSCVVLFYFPHQLCCSRMGIFRLRSFPHISMRSVGQTFVVSHHIYTNVAAYFYAKRVGQTFVVSHHIYTKCCEPFQHIHRLLHGGPRWYFYIAP